MNNKGYSAIELLVVIIVTGIIATVLIVKTSYAFDDNSAGLYKQEVLTITNAAKNYAYANQDIFEKNNVVKVKVNELVKKEFLPADDKDGNVYDPRAKGVYFNEMDVKITKDGDKIKAELVIEK
ncbi:MAG: prepilin-type N-terminal cleavage/methylation domain-containing protein [Bacilli bacterium]|nr:prepilin-type N-terminal cleavage/methylation domain-containing protein [Bacilli bacterium]